MGVKKTSELIPMCHPLPIQKCAIDYELDQEKNRIHVFCTVKTEGKQVWRWSTDWCAGDASDNL